MSLGLFKHPIFGQTRVYNFDNKRTMEIWAEPKQAISWGTQYNKIKKLEWKYCLIPNEVKQQKNVVKLYYDNYSVSLKHQIINRAKRRQPFTQSQILYILFCITKAFRQWKRFWKKQSTRTYQYTSISSQHILFNQIGQIKLVIPLTFPGKIPQNNYYPPQDQPQTRLNNASDKYSLQTSFSFSLGIICIQLMILKSGQLFYDFRNGGIIRFLDLKRQLEIYKDQYGIIGNFVSLMIDSDKNHRIKMSQINAILAPYQQDIILGNQIQFDRQICSNSLRQYLYTLI